MAEAWRMFTDVPSWPRWNPCFRWARAMGGDLRLGAVLVWVFGPIRWWMPYRMPAAARVVEYEPERRVTWEVGALPGFHARHSYLFEPLGPDRCRFGSWETAEGPTFRWLRWFWLAHFRYVCRTSLAGATTLPARREGVRRVRHGRPPPSMPGSPSPAPPSPSSPSTSSGPTASPSTASPWRRRS